jgi:Tfp pilus assembly PilM family ATPase
MARKKLSITGLAVNKDSICMAQFVPEEEIVTNVGIQLVDALDDDFWEAAASGLKELGHTVKLAGANVVSALPGEHSVIRKIFIDAEEEDSDEALEWELNQQIIGAREEYVFDFEKCASSSKKGMQQYLAVGYRAESVDDLNRVLRSSRLNPLIIDLDIFALINVYDANYSERKLLPAILVLSEESQTKCILALNGTFMDFETISHESGLPDVDNYTAALNSTIENMLACNPDVKQRELLKVYLAGSMFTDTTYAGQLQKAVKNSEMLEPFRKVVCETELGEKDLKRHSPQLAVAVGLALRGIDLG